MEEHLTIAEIIHEMEENCGYLTAVLLGIYYMCKYHGWTVDDWDIEFDDISSDYRLFITTLKELL